MDGWQIGEQTFHLLLLPEVGHQSDREIDRAAVITGGRSPHLNILY